MGPGAVPPPSEFSLFRRPLHPVQGLSGPQEGARLGGMPLTDQPGRALDRLGDGCARRDPRRLRQGFQLGQGQQRRRRIAGAAAQRPQVQPLGDPGPRPALRHGATAQVGQADVEASRDGWSGLSSDIGLTDLRPGFRPTIFAQTIVLHPGMMADGDVRNGRMPPVPIAPSAQFCMTDLTGLGAPLRFRHGRNRHELIGSGAIRHWPHIPGNLAQQQPEQGRYPDQMGDDHETQQGSERFLARLVAQKVLTHPGADAPEQGHQKQGGFPHTPAMVTRLILVEPEQAEGRQFRKGEKDQRPVNDGDADHGAQP